MAEPLRSFAPLLPAGTQSPGSARVLVLGSMPGRASLDAQQYYAHPRNAFWPIVAAHCGIDPASDYPTRVQALLDAGIVLWDVLAQCRRPGSLDSAIELADAQPNAIAELLDAHPTNQTRVLQWRGSGAAVSAFSLARSAACGSDPVAIDQPGACRHAAGGEDAALACGAVAEYNRMIFRGKRAGQGAGAEPRVTA